MINIITSSHVDHTQQFPTKVTMMTRSLRIAILTLLVASLSAAARADEQGGPREACKNDVQSFCADAQGDPQQAKSCLEDHYQQISDACYAVLKNASAGGASGGAGGMRQACKDDAQNFCQGVQPGGGRIIACLEDHFKEISDTCYTALKNKPSGQGGSKGNGNGG